MKKKVKNSDIRKIPKINSHFASNIKFRKYIDKLAKKSNDVFKNIAIEASKEKGSISVYLYKHKFKRALEKLEDNIDKTISKFLESLQLDIRKYISKKYSDEGFPKIESIEKSKEIDNVNRANIYRAIDLIKSIPRDILESYMSLLYNNISSLNREMIYKFSREVAHVNKNRAKTIARDQIAKSIVNYNIAQAKDNGLEYYIWLTADDSRVSEDHRHLNNRIYSYSDPTAVIDKKGTIGHPAQRVNCRCVPVSVFLEPDQELVLKKDSKYGDYYEIVKKS